MRRSGFLRLLLLALVLIGVNFGGFAYAHLARSTVGNPFFGNQADANGLVAAYLLYLQQLMTVNLTDGAIYGDDFGRIFLDAMLASLGLLLASLVVSVAIGFSIGLLGVRMHPPGVRSWLIVIATVGLATPSFFLGRLIVALFLLMILYVPGTSMPLPIQGFGWDVHLILPVMALSLRPTAQIGQIMAGLLASELSRQYVMAARGRGLSAVRVVRHHALRNVWAPLAHALAGTVRLMAGELVVVEWLFAWPGVGHLLAATLIPAQFASASVESRFLDPPLVASILTVFAALFIITDLLAGQAAALADPRQRQAG